MKKFYVSVVFFVAILLNTSYSQLLDENFDYTTGDTLINVGWTQSGTTTTNPIVVTSPGLTYTGYPSIIGNAATLTTTGQDDYYNFSASGPSSGNVYMSFLMNVTAAQTGDYFIALSAASSQTNYYDRIHLKSSGSGYVIGVSKSNEVSGGAIYGTTEFAFNTTYLVVTKYVFNPDTTNDDAISIYVLSSGTPYFEPTTAEIDSYTNGTKTDAADISTVTLRQGSLTAAASLTVDGIRVGTSWNEVINGFSAQLLTLAEAREDLDVDGIPDRLGDTVLVHGTVISPNYQTTNHSYYIWDGTAGITEYLYGTTSPVLNLGDSVAIVGYIAQYRGLNEFTPLSADAISIISSGNATPEPLVLTLAQYKANPEAYEGTLVGFVSLSKASGTWPSAGSSATLKITDGTDTVDYRIDSDTDVDNGTEPSWPADIIGIGSQFTSSTSAYFDGYQILPRYYASDILPPGTIPVELTSFIASVSGRSVTLNWTTATELNNSGFNIERKTASSSWQKISFVSGNGTTTQQNSYSYTDRNLADGKYSYRLKQVDLDGTFEYSKTVEINISTVKDYELSQNYPNPFNPTTKITFNIPEAGNVKLAIYNLLGQEVKVLVNGFTEAGNHTVDFAGSNLASGIYLYKIEANGFIQTRKMTLLK